MMTRFIIPLLLLLLGSVAQAQFTVYREFFFSGQPSEAYFDSLGMKRSHGVYEAEVTGGSPAVKQNLMISTAQNTAAKYQLYQNRMWYDIEYLSCDSFVVGKSQAIANADTLAKYIHWAKQAAPSLQVGLYSIVPVADPYIFTHLAKRQSANDLVQRLADSLSFLCPSLYLFYSESTLPYANYAVPMVQEARRMAKGKKVFVFVAPGYHDAGDHDGQYATRAVWANVLNTIKNSGADGMIIFGGRGAMGTQPYAWSYIDTCGWWQATKEFMSSLNSGPIASPPAAPTIVSPGAGSVIDPSGWSAVWRNTQGATKYQFQLATRSSFSTLLISDSTLTDTLCNMGTLANSDTYYIHVRAKNNVGWGAYGNTIQFSTVAAPPAIIEPQSGTKQSGKSVNSRWSRVRGASSYQIQFSGTSTFAASEINDSTIVDTVKSVVLSNGEAQYYCRVRAKTVAGWTAWSPAIDFVTGADVSSAGEERGVPTAFELAQNFPNPFNPGTTIRFSLPLGAHVRLTVYNTLGQVVRMLVDDDRDAGYYELHLDGTAMSSGMYYYRLEAGAFTATKKLLLLK